MLIGCNSELIFIDMAELFNRLHLLTPRYDQVSQPMNVSVDEQTFASFSQIGIVLVADLIDYVNIAPWHQTSKSHNRPTADDSSMRLTLFNLDSISIGNQAFRPRFECPRLL